MALKDRRQVRTKPNYQVDPSVQAQLEQFIAELARPPRTFTRGQIVTGKVVSVAKGEILVDVGGRAEGVVAGREMKLEGEKLDRQPGEEVLVYVIKPENEKGQIELSIRRTGLARKWHELKSAQTSDDSIKVKAVEANTGGLIVDIGGGLRGFIPTSQLDSSRLVTTDYGDKEKATQEMQVKLTEMIGEEIEVKIIEIDREKNRVIFSEKMVTSGADMQQRAATLAKSKTGDMLEAEVTGIAPFGLFVNAQGLEGLVHLSEISWDKVANPSEFYAVGDKVKVQIIGIQDDGKRVAYSIKRLQEDPWDALVSGFEVNDVVTAAVTKVVDYGAFVRLDNGLNGLVHISELSDKLVRDPGDIVQNGQRVSLMIISISKEDRHLGLSLKRVKKADPDEVVEVTPRGKKSKAKREIAPEMESLKELLGEDESESAA